MNSPQTLAYSYGTVRISPEVALLMRVRFDSRPVYGPPEPKTPHACNCQFCDIAFEEDW
ncbi:MAG TPA: hypothetical protein VK903_06740 [Propionicimonas sp.]|nr:hypothetical protein [Propionicimonas sp.]